MELEATLAAPPPVAPPARAGASGPIPALLAAAFFLAAWQIRQAPPYTPASGTGYALGLIGGSLMLALLLYPVRKRIRALQVLGPLKHWFRFHLAAGILGPLCVLFHSTFRVGSFNAAIALSSMLLVVASGLVGRFIYRRIHHGLFGSRASLQELQQALARQMEALQPLLADLPAAKAEIERYAGLVARQPAGRGQRMGQFLALGWQRRLVGRRVRAALAGRVAPARFAGLAATLDDVLRAAQKTAQFSTYERLFSLWHVIHIPFLWLLILTAIAHVVAVHAY